MTKKQKANNSNQLVMASIKFSKGCFIIYKLIIHNVLTDNTIAKKKTQAAFRETLYSIKIIIYLNNK